GVGFFFGFGEYIQRRAAQVRLCVAAISARAIRQHLFEFCLHGLRTRTDLCDDFRHHPVLLTNQRDQHVQGFESAVTIFSRKRLSFEQRFLCFVCIPVHIHRSFPRKVSLYVLWVWYMKFIKIASEVDKRSLVCGTFVLTLARSYDGR